MELFPTTTGYSSYFLVNLIASLVALATFVYIYFNRRYMFVKPSVMILGCYHVLCQWPQVLLSAFLENFLPSPWIFAALVHGFVLIGLAISFVTFNQSASSIWEHLPSRQLNVSASNYAAGAVFGIGCVLAAIYLYYVPFKETGLYTLIYDPSHAAEARELSLKLLQSWIPKYALNLLSNTIAPLFTAIVTYFILLNRETSFVAKLIWFALLMLCWGASMFNGAKGIFVFLAFVVMGTIAWNSRLKFSIGWIIGGICIILLPAVSVTLLLATVDQKFKNLPYTSEVTTKDTSQTPSSPTASSGQPTSETTLQAGIPATPNAPTAKDLCMRRFVAKKISTDAAQIQQNLNQAIEKAHQSAPSDDISVPSPRRELKGQDFASQTLETSKRSFVLPMVVAAWYADYAQRNGAIGIAGIPRAATFLGIQPIDLANRIGLIYAPCYYGHEVIETISATTGFLFAQYGYFGFFALPLALLGLMICDGLLLIVRLLPTTWSVPTLAVISLDALKFTQSDYLTIWITHGLAINMLLIVVLALWLKRERTAAPALQ